jgi:glutamate-1-semialdehyde 2,1-aminomutase
LVKGGSGILTCALPDSAGVPKAFTEHTLVAPFNDLDTVHALFSTFGEDIAAIIIEPVAGNMNCIPPTPGFLEGLKAISVQYGSVLIFDEVMTGFRVALGGAQALYNIQPDLSCLGKIIGGGLPVGAFGGKREIMQCLAPVGSVYQAGTLSGNPITLSAGLATLKVLQEPGLYDTLSQHTKDLMLGLEKQAEYYNIPLKTHCVGGMFGLFFSTQTTITRYEEMMKCDIASFNQFFHGMLKEGIYFAPSAFETGFVSTAHSSETLDHTLQAASTVFARWIP